MMSGGHFDYKQYHIGDIAKQIERLIKDNEDTKCWTEETIAQFNNAIVFLRMSSVLAQRIDWLVCGDDSEESFHKRLKEELDNL